MTDFAAARTAMVDCQVRPSDVTKFPIIDALLSTPREIYVPASKQSVAYVGEHIALTKDRFLLDARVFAKLLDAVNIQSTEMVLDIGCGMGYSTAIIAKLAEAVVGIDDDQDLVNAASKNFEEQLVDNAVVQLGNLALGAPKHGPYDVIVVQGGVQEIPDTLVDQLNDGGRIAAIFCDGQLGHCKIGYKTHGVVSWNDDFDATAPVLKDFAKKHNFSFA